MRFVSNSSYLFKVTPVFKKDDAGNDTKEIKFYRLTFRDSSISATNMATTCYFDVVPSAELTKKYEDTFVDMVGKLFHIEGNIIRTYNKETEKGFTNFWLDTLTAV